MEYIPFYAIVEFFDVYDLIILRQVSKYYERNVRKIAKINEFGLYNFDYGLKIIKMFDNITFELKYDHTQTQEIQAYEDLYDKIINLEIHKSIPRKIYKKFTKLTHPLRGSCKHDARYARFIDYIN